MRKIIVRVVVLTVLGIIPFTAFYSVFQIYLASETRFEETEFIQNSGRGDSFWAQLEISTDNEDTLGYVAYSVYDHLNFRGYLWQRRNIRNHFPDTILINISGKKNVPLLLDVSINANQLEFVSLYDSPVIGHFDFQHRSFSTTNLTERIDKTIKRIQGLKEKDRVVGQYKVVQTNPLMLSTSNPFWVEDPDKIWNQYFGDGFVKMSLGISSLFLILWLLIVFNLIRQKVTSLRTNK